MVKIVKHDDDISINSSETSAISDGTSVARSTNSSSSYNTFSSISQGIGSLKAATHEYLNKRTCSISKLLKLSVSAFIGIGSGFAMMPIFDQEIEELEDIGISVEDNRGISAVITVNTLLVFGSLATISLYYFMQSKKDDKSTTEIQKVALKLGAVASVCSSVLPVSQLWNVELSDQEYISSSGFDEFVVWATVTTLPLCVYKSIDAYVYINSFIKGKLAKVYLDSVGDKLFLYMPAALSAAGRFIAFSASATELGVAMGIGDELSLVLGVLIGGVVGGSVVGLAEYEAVKSLFAKQQEKLSYKQLFGGTICALEGMLLTLPLITTGLDVIKDTNPLVKGILFSPLFVSHSLFEARTIYMAFNNLINKKEEQEIPDYILSLRRVTNLEQNMNEFIDLGKTHVEDVANNEQYHQQSEMGSSRSLELSGHYSEINEI